MAKEYTYLKCSHLKGNCNQKPVNENTILKQLEDEVFNNLSISENMASAIVDNIKTYFEDDKVAIAAIKRSITNDLNKLKEKENRLFDFYLEGNIDKATYDKKKSEIDMEVAELEKTQEKYSNCNQDMTKTAQSVVDIALNAGKIFKSSKIHQKRQFLGLLLSNCKIKGKKLMFSITKPFDRLLKTTDFAEWLGY